MKEKKERENVENKRKKRKRRKSFDTPWFQRRPIFAD